MSRRTRGVVATALVAAMVGITAQAAMADAPDAAQSIAVAKTGSTGRDLVGSEVKGHGVTASSAKSKDGEGLRTLVQDSADGVAVLAVLEEGQSSATFNGLLPAGSTITAAEGGDHQVLTPDGTRLTVKAPWARDATGKSLPTSYTFAVGSITQNVDTTGATFPVVADPTVTPVSTQIPVVDRVHFNRAETLKVARPDGLDKALLACQMAKDALGLPVDCVLGVTQIAADVDTAARTSGRCLFIQVKMGTRGVFPLGVEVAGFYESSGTEAC